MDTKEFFEWDFNSTLYPLKTNLIVIKNHHIALENHITKILSVDPVNVGFNFLPQTRVYAPKPKGHLRRTHVLDPIASYFVYDLILRNRGAFGGAKDKKRRAFGYTFEAAKPVSVHKSYTEFMEQVEANHSKHYKHMISFDIASFFNSIYHHDAVNWFASLPGVTGPDVNAFGQFFREMNSGRSIDFLPHGIYPTKMIGSEFLRFIDLSGQIKCAQTLRFMDDIYLFDNDKQVLAQDFLRIQELLGLRSLNVNPSKTVFDADIVSIKEKATELEDKLDEILPGHAGLVVYMGSGADMDSADWDDGLYEEDEDELSEEQISALKELMLDPKAGESDVEMILGILHDHTDSPTELIPELILRYPSIVKQLYKIASESEPYEREELAEGLLKLVDVNQSLQEFQLFWIASIAEDCLSKAKCFGALILKIYERSANFKIARAKVLEIPDQSFGLKDIREEVLKTGASDWPSWAAAAGTRTLNKAERNYALKYFSKGSPVNFLISECVQAL